ncbi:AMP-binding protein [Uliginosibacterium sp. sgz301328]|uniref:AMP-binding protein n=1 Tax=Uliginosibacterium sp. sgz301328 TaxID=3243764 RepID=UPI00359E3A2C
MAEVSLTALLVRTDDNVIGIRDNQPVRRSAFHAAINGWQHTLAALPQQRLALFETDTLGFAAALLGGWAAGKTLVLPGDALPGTIESLRNHVEGFIGAFPGQLLTTTPAPIEPTTSLPTLDGDDTRLEVFTSGSSGSPVAITKKLTQLDSEIATLGALFGTQLNGCVIRGTVSHQHIYGLLFRVLLPLSQGIPLDAHALLYPEDIIAAAAHGPFALIASPAHLARLPDTLPWADASDSIRMVFSSGGPLAPEAAAHAGQLLGRYPVEVYGSSETGGIATRSRDRDGDLWSPMPGISLSTDDASRLLVRSTHLPDDSPFICADRALLHDDGRFALLGRVDRIVKVEEKRVSLDAIETHLLAMDEVDTVRALITEHGSRRLIAAVVVLSPRGRQRLATEGKRVLNAALKAHLAQHVEPVALPRRWRYVDALPINNQGKTTQAALAALFDLADRPTLPLSTLMAREAAQVTLHWEIPEDLYYFEGHFPGSPVLAGVVQLDWVVRFSREHFALPPAFQRVEALKFQRVIQPAARLKVELVHKPDAGTVAFRIASQDGSIVFSSGRVNFGEAA